MTLKTEARAEHIRIGLRLFGRVGIPAGDCAGRRVPLGLGI